MRPVFRGAASIFLIATLGGCMAPMGQREAQTIANQRLVKYCNARCGKLTLDRTQKIKDRWLVDFDAPRHKYTVTVEGNGSASVDVWNK